MVAKRTILDTVARHKPVIPHEREPSSVCLAQRHQNMLDGPIPMNPLNHVGEEIRFDLNGIVDDPKCKLSSVDLIAAFQVDTSEALRTV